jgi:hypothetical protein
LTIGDWRLAIDGLSSVDEIAGANGTERATVRARSAVSLSEAPEGTGGVAAGAERQD